MNPVQISEMLAQYYNDPNVRSRLLEFAGGPSLESVTAEFITGDDENADVEHHPRPSSELWDCLRAKCEIGRSLWDRQSLIVDLDVDYVNFDQPALPFVQPKICYEYQRPVASAVQSWLLKSGIAPFHWISGQGHHFAWKLDQASEAFGKLAGLGHLTQSLEVRYQSPSEPNGNCVGLELGAAFSGLGMVMQYVAEQIKQACQSVTEIPIALTAVETGPGNKKDLPQREVIALDVSEYGDPLDSRGIRMPFSVYLKPGQKRYQLGDPLVDAMPPMFPVPLFEIEMADALEVMRDSTKVMALAARASTSIPDFSDPMLKLIEDYLASPLAKFHQRFYEEHHEPPERWPETYDRLYVENFPPCVTQPLQQPNDLLLKPGIIQHVVRTLMSHDWSPRQIAGLIRSRYERDCEWGDRWVVYDAASRADFYVRMFAGAIVTGSDELIDFNCKSTQEKHYCPVEHCEFNLVHLREKLVGKMNEASLGSGTK